MKASLKPNAQGLTINIEQTGDQQKELLESLQACQEGRCSCPTDEYRKLTGMQVDAEGQKVEVTLTAKQGETIDPAEVQRCLDHTLGKLKAQEPPPEE